MKSLVLAAVLVFAAVPASAQSAPPASMPAAGTEFRDCPVCPRMVVMPQGNYMRGSPANETGRSDNEGPAYRVTIAYPLAIAKNEVTFEEWDYCVADRVCKDRNDQLGEGRNLRPVVFVSWHDAQDYVRWLSQKTGKAYRVPTGAEWEYGARAGTKTPYWWGKTASHEYANYGGDKCCSDVVKGRDQWLKTGPVGSFPANPFGLHDMQGNVWEWVDECLQETYSGAPADGSANRDGDCRVRAHMGGSYGSLPVQIRASFREFYGLEDRDDFIGFRIARGE